MKYKQSYGDKQRDEQKRTRPAVPRLPGIPEVPQEPAKEQSVIAPEERKKSVVRKRQKM